MSLTIGQYEAGGFRVVETRALRLIHYPHDFITCLVLADKDYRIWHVILDDHLLSLSGSR